MNGGRGYVRLQVRSLRPTKLYCHDAPPALVYTMGCDVLAISGSDEMNMMMIRIPISEFLHEQKKSRLQRDGFRYATIIPATGPNRESC